MVNQLSMLCKRNYLTVEISAESDEYIEVETDTGEMLHERFIGFMDAGTYSANRLVTCRGWRMRFEDSWSYTTLYERAAAVKLENGLYILIEGESPLLITKEETD